MSGYTISLYKFMRIDENLHKKKQLLECRNKIIDRQESGDKQDDATDKVEHKKFLAYGEFDKIGFERVERFTKFRDISENAKAWVGDRQTHLIYSICQDEKENEIYYENGKFYERQGKEAVQSSRLFLGITILQMKYSEKEKCEDMKKYLSTCREQILSLVKDNAPEVKCTVMGTLGSFGLTILWLSDQYTDILKLVTDIRKIDIGNEGRNHKSIFFSSYTIFAQNHRYGENWEQRIEAIKGKAILYLTLKKGAEESVCRQLAKWRIEDSSLYHCAGEHDIMIRMDSKKVYGIFDHGNELYYDSEFFRDNILQSNVDLCEDQKILQMDDEQKNDNMQENIFSNVEPSKLIPDVDEILEEYKKLRKKFIEIFPSTTGMVDTLDMLFSDYISKMSSASNELWVDTFSHQFLQILKCINIFCGNLQCLRLAREDELMIINDLLSDFERQISHIAESNNLVLGTPVCQFRYSGQNNLTLYAYFGIIKNILRYIYKSQKVSRQDEIVPLIVADIVPIIQSTLYVDYKENKDDAKIVTINLPMVALYNPICYYPYLYHEIFHYVVPKDRTSRNKVMGCLISIEILLNVLKESMNHKLSANNFEIAYRLSDFADIYLMPYIYTFVLDNYETCIENRIQDVDIRDISCKEMSEKELVASTYEQKLFDRWIEWLSAEGSEVKLNNNPIYKFMCYISVQGDKIKSDLELWKNQTSEISGWELAQRVMEEVLCEFAGIANNIVPEAKMESFMNISSRWDDDILNHSIVFADALKEALADIAMVGMGKMDFAEYLLLFTKTKRDLLISSDKQENIEQDNIRVGMVFDYLYSGSCNMEVPIQMIDTLKEKYINIYCGMFFSAHRANENKEEYYENLHREAEEWFMYWKKCCHQYLINYRIYSALLRELRELHLVTDEQDSVYWKEYVKLLDKLGYFIKKQNAKENPNCWMEMRTSVDKSIFNLNLQFIHDFQKQYNFSELNSIRIEKNMENGEDRYTNYCNIGLAKLQLQNAINSDSNTKNLPRWEYIVGSIGETTTVIADIAEMLDGDNHRVLGDGEYPLWYRGHASDKYELLPSLMRKYKAKKEQSRDKEQFQLDNFLKREYEEFKYQADGTHEIIDRIGYTDGDYIALMQHYSVASNFLDWTDNALPAFYFALESFFDSKVKKVNDNAAIYVFSPALYNHARVKILSDERLNKKDRTAIERRLMQEKLTDHIPNITVSYNSERYFMYLLGSQELDGEGIGTYTARADEEYKWKYYVPMAVYVSRLNERIRAQSGYFMAYNIYTKPDQNDEFKHVALEKIQEKYLKEYASDADTCPFLYKVIIKEDKRKEIAAWAKSFGLSKEKCYPELVNIGERIMR